jgi:hypothetical protein
MTDLTPPAREEAGGAEPLLDSFLREAVPEIKLSIGDLIDRDNSRAIPDRYVKLLPQASLVVTLRPDVARAVASIAADLEAELTDSANRHGSLYDREYRVRLTDAGSPGAPLFRVNLRADDAKVDEAPVAASGPDAAELPHPSSAPSEPPPDPVAPAMDPDATRMDGVERPPFPSGRYVLVAPGGGDTEEQRFPLLNPVTSVGRETDNPALRSDVQLAGHPNVSRRQLALVWAPREEGDGFLVYNVGLNAVHVDEREVPGANAGRGALRLEALDDHSVWMAPGAELRVGAHGPALRIEEAPEPAEDPDATQFG